MTTTGRMSCVRGIEMLELFYRHIAIPAFESVLKRRQTFRYWRDLEQSQWLSVGELQARQVDSLRILLRHAASNSPYYSNAWRMAGLDPQRVCTLQDYEQWPLIDRDVIRAHRQEMRAANCNARLIHKATGGSSGVPLEFDLDEDSNDRRMAAWHRGYGWAGAAPGTRQWYLWGGAVGAVTNRKRTKDAFYNWLYRRCVTSSFGMSDERIPWFLEQLNRCRPDAIVAYTNPLYYFARVLNERGLTPYSPRSIVVGAEKLHEFQRELIERVFRAPVFETYGSREFMLIGGECERHCGLHLTMENLLVEIVDDDGAPTLPGEEGNVVVTDLTNFGMPFIRYLNGDRAIAGFETCTCGRGLPLLKKVIGRQLDMLTTSDGRFVPGELFPHLIKEFTAVRRFQVIQESADAIRLKVVVNSEWSESVREALDRQIREIIGSVVKFEIQVVDDIPLTAAGKLQVVVRRCEPAPASRHNEEPNRSVAP